MSAWKEYQKEVHTTNEEYRQWFRWNSQIWNISNNVVIQRSTGKPPITFSAICTVTEAVEDLDEAGKNVDKFYK